MGNYVLFRLYGPLASWGEIAVGEDRHSAVQPSRSALLGLIGAALGIDRDDDVRQNALARGYRFGIKMLSVGAGLRDYHTVQWGVPPRKRVFRSRREELSAEKVNTILSEREYRCDSIAVVAVDALDSAPADLDELVKALRHPHYVLYLGRKSCPLAAPLSPQRVSGRRLGEALDTTSFPSLMALTRYREPNQPWPHEDDKRSFRLAQTRYYWEDGIAGADDLKPDMEGWRHDQPLSRSRWQFARRREWIKLQNPSQESS